LSILNDILYGLPHEGINMRLEETRAAEFTLTDEFYFWVPPEDVMQDSVDKFAYQGTWDASANSPALTNKVGTVGHVYRVSTAGSTTLNTIDDWQLYDFLMYGEPKADVTGPYSSVDTNWFRGIRVRRFDDAISAMLALRLTEELGHDVSGHMLASAKKGRNALYNAFAKPQEKNNYDSGIVYSASRSRYFTGDEL